MKRLAFLTALLVLGACQRAEGQKPKEPARPVQPAPPAPPPDAPRRQDDVSAQDFVAAPLPRAKVVLKDAYGGAHPVEVEVAAQTWSRTRGLMWRTELPEGKGMLFIFPYQGELSFWMRNTLIPLDMLFMDSQGTIVGIVERAEPRTLTSRGPGRPAQYVLEVPGGWASKVGVVPGSKVAFEGLQGIAVE